ncbi:XcbB/CpsF family capsular polysaccharide biosynthesis protein [Brevibacterium atlanticum]|uniref:XcbB/CpsF family capsular polysaccharide biosynthesis protein n=1 Tax=Brevibacterium atlanticum TaxID=2697563 RepID=UPI00142085E1|nr:XcbB/CpsF family capsular polysaccharide biosynthesis protein [Brevibacterium atlanticum]
MNNNILWLTLETDPDNIASMVSANGGLPRYFRVDTTTANDPETDMMKLSLRNQATKKLLLKLTNLGYSLYYNTHNESRFVRHDRIVHHWPAVKDGTFAVSEQGIVHVLEQPASGVVERLVVIMSPINSKPRLIRYFRPSFATLMKYVPRNTAILRIADIGGVKGAFYLNTSFSPDNSARIQRLVRTTISNCGLDDSNVVFFGASKGGTGALFHGLTGGWKFVAVDPILSDKWYVENENDYHFTTGGVFPQTKQEVFESLIRQAAGGELTVPPDSVIVTSARSPQYAYSTEIVAPIVNQLTMFNSDNPEIKKHPDVAPKTIYSHVLSINSLLLGIPLPKGEHPIP